MIDVEKAAHAVLQAPYDLRAEQIDLPKLGKCGVLFGEEPFRCTAKHPHLVTGQFPGAGRKKFPCVSGPEDACEIVGIGEGVRGFEVGDRVMALERCMCQVQALHSGRSS